MILLATTDIIPCRKWSILVYIDNIYHLHVLFRYMSVLAQSKVEWYNEIVYKIAFSLYSSLLSIRYFEMGSYIYPARNTG